MNLSRGSSQKAGTMAYDYNQREKSKVMTKNKGGHYDKRHDYNHYLFLREIEITISWKRMRD